MKKKSFLVITELFLPTKGGTAVWFGEVYPRIGDADTHIVTKTVEGDIAYDEDQTITVHRLALSDSSRIKPAALPRYIKLFFFSLRLALKNRFTAIHAGRVLPEGLVALVVARLTFQRCVIYAHGEEITTWSRSPKRLRAMTFAYKYADTVIANSEFTRKQLLNLGVPAKRISLIYPGVDISKFRPGPPHDDLRCRLTNNSSSRIILSVGRLSRRKGFDNVIRGLTDVSNSVAGECHYALIGIGEDEEYLKHLALDCGVEERVHFLGHVPLEDLSRWYNTCDVFVMPNREINGDTEGFGMVFIEAGACGKPVISGDAGGTGDAVIDGETGFRVDGNSVEGIADKIITLLNDSVMASTMGNAGNERAIKELSWERVASKTIELGL